MNLDFKIVLLAKDARSYYDAYQLLDNQDHSMYFSTPALLCLSFSVELHVKLLLLTHDIKARGHNIGNLLKKLPKDDLTFISTHLDLHPTQQSEYFFQNIAIASNLFIEARYYFENVETPFHFNSGFCTTLTKVIRKRIVERAPFLSHDLGTSSD